MNFQEADNYLNSLRNSERLLGTSEKIEFSLENIKELLSKFGNPQKDLRIIHVAGSKGKGSTCAFMANILKCAGYKVGLYTSPHLYSRRERIRLLSNDPNSTMPEDLFPDQISKQGLCSLLDFVKVFADQIEDVTFFEVFTAVALLFFKHNNADVVILETGLGGRLDATNAVSSDICVITPISLEHTELLGDSLAEIAGEKAAVIKKGTKAVISAEQQPEVMDVLIKKCAEENIQPEILHEDFMMLEQTSLKGQHQDENASVAIAVVGVLEGMGFNISKNNIIKGISTVIWPGRFEIVRQNPNVILDCAHNGASARALKTIFTEEFPGKKAVIIFGISSDKNVEDISEELAGICKEVIFTASKHPRALDAKELEAKDIFSGIKKRSAGNIKDALDIAFDSSGKEGIILVAGSLFLVAEARKTLGEG